MKLLHQGNHTLTLSRRSDLDFAPHLHNALEIVRVDEGRAALLYGGTRVPLEPGDLAVIFPNRIHGFADSRDIRALMLIVPVSPYLADFRDVMERRTPESPVLHRALWVGSGVGQLMEMALADRAAADPRITQGYLTLIVAKLLPLLPLRDAPGHPAGALEAALRYLDGHYRQPLSRREMARAIGYSESYLSHLFSDVLHTTLTGAVTSLRLDDAARLLGETDTSVSRISVLLGFGSIRSFNRAFRAAYGRSPSQYRRARKEHAEAFLFQHQ